MGDDEQDEQGATAHDFAVERQGPTTYRLTGTVTAPTTGWEVEIHPMSDGIVPEPGLARFLVHVIAPGPDVITQPKVTDHVVDETFEEDAALETVVVHLQGATTEDGAADIRLTVA